MSYYYPKKSEDSGKIRNTTICQSTDISYNSWECRFCLQGAHNLYKKPAGNRELSATHVLRLEAWLEHCKDSKQAGMIGCPTESEKGHWLSLVGPLQIHSPLWGADQYGPHLWTDLSSAPHFNCRCWLDPFQFKSNPGLRDIVLDQTKLNPALKITLYGKAGHK